MSTEVVAYLSPEIVLLLAAIGIYMGGAFTKSAGQWFFWAMGAVLVAALCLWQCSPTAAKTVASSVAYPPVLADGLAHFGRWLALAVAVVMILMSARPLASGGTPEFFGSLLLIIAGSMLVSTASNLVLMFVGLELVSIPTYIILSLGRRDAHSQEAAAKYFYLSILASAVLLYGLSFLYGTTGTMQLTEIRDYSRFAALSPAGFAGLVKIGAVLVIAGLCFRITAVPFHFYAPDVYEGTIQANAALLSVIPKAAGLIALLRLVVLAVPDFGTTGWKLAIALSMLTMTLGNVLALWQNNVRRLLAYSSIANAGYMLIGIAVALGTGGLGTSGLGTAGIVKAGWWDGVGAMLFYLCAYAAATLGVFAAFTHLGRQRLQVETVDELAGLGRTHPAMAAAVATCMFSLAGLPPAGGLWGKLFLFMGALNVEAGQAGDLRPWFIALAVVGVVNAAIGAAYYLRIVATMYFREPLTTPRAEGGPGPWLAAVGCALAVLALGIYPLPLINSCRQASGVLEVAQSAPPVASPQLVAKGR